jgi:hypothetical protein
MSEDRTGCIDNFKLQPFLDVINELMRCDETIRALWVCDNLPAYQRDYPPKEISALKREIQKRIATANFYATSADYELRAPDHSSYAMEHSLRGMMMIKDIENLNKKGFVPLVGDIGNGEYWLPQLLNHKGLKFDYFPIYVNWPSHNHYRDRWEKNFSDKLKENQPTIFFAGEIIEHLWKEDELKYSMERWIGLADIVHISTPNRTFDTACTNWLEKNDIGHLRAYTPMEFTKTVTEMFPEYAVVALQSQILHARGTLKETKFQCIKDTANKNILE